MRFMLRTTPLATKVTVLACMVACVLPAAAIATIQPATEFSALGVGTSPAATGLQVYGNAASGSLVNVTQTGTGAHALTTYLAANGGPSQAAFNAVSNNQAFSAAEITGVEKSHGTLKIAHVGFSDGSDANAAALSIDTQTGSGAGTRAQGIFLTSTTDLYPLGDPFKIRENNADLFAIKGRAAGGGVVVVNGSIGHNPAGMVDVTQTPSLPALVLRNANGLAVALSVDSNGNLVATTASGHTVTLATN